MAQVVAKTSRLRAAEYAGYAQSLIKFFQESNTFDKAGDRLQSLIDSLADLQNSESQLDKYLQDVREQRRSIDMARKKIKASVKRLVLYVNDSSDGDEMLLSQSPFPLMKEAQPQTIPVQVSGLKVSPSRLPGQVLLKWKPLGVATKYIVQYSTDPENEESWKTHPINPSSARLSLTVRIGIDEEGISRKSASKVYFRVAGISGEQSGRWSNLSFAYVA